MNTRPHPDLVVEDLRAGNRRFLDSESTQSSESSLKKLRDYAISGQFPKAIVLCCSDSRAPVEIIFDQDIGDLFVIRVAGNIIAPSLVGSVEYAASMYKTRLVLVMGHSQCGAVTATLDHIEDPTAVWADNIHDIVARIKPHILSIAKMKDVSRDGKIDLAVHANVLASVSQLSHSSRLIESLVNEGKMKIVGAVLELSTGYVEFMEE